MPSSLRISRPSKQCSDRLSISDGKNTRRLPDCFGRYTGTSTTIPPRKPPVRFGRAAGESTLSLLPAARPREPRCAPPRSFVARVAQIAERFAGCQKSAALRPIFEHGACIVVLPEASRPLSFPLCRLDGLTILAGWTGQRTPTRPRQPPPPQPIARRRLLASRTSVLIPRTDTRDTSLRSGRGCARPPHRCKKTNPRIL